MFFKNTKRRYENKLRGSLENYWEIFCKNAVFCKNTDTWPTKILTRGLQEHWQVVYKNTEKCSAKILKGVLHSTQNEQLLCKNSGTWSVSMPFYFRRPKFNTHLLRTKVTCKSLILINIWKGGTGDRRSYDL